MLDPSFCQKLPDRADPNSAVFLGIVKHVEMPAPEAFAGPARMQPGQVGQSRARAGDPRPEPAKRYPIARLQVLENFTGAEAAEFEVRLTSDFFVDSIPQGTPALAEGDVWLIDAYRDRQDQVWTTSNCQRTKRAEQAVDDLRVLRTWAAGQRLPGKINGQVWNPTEHKSFPGTQISLRGGKQMLSTTTDRQGLFVFENLDPGIYEVLGALPQGSVAGKADLTRGWCSQVILLVPPL